MFIDLLGASLLGNMLTGEILIRGLDGVIETGDRVFESKQDF